MLVVVFRRVDLKRLGWLRMLPDGIGGVQFSWGEPFDRDGACFCLFVLDVFEELMLLRVNEVVSRRMHLSLQL